MLVLVVTNLGCKFFYAGVSLIIFCPIARKASVLQLPSAGHSNVALSMGVKYLSILGETMV